MGSDSVSMMKIAPSQDSSSRCLNQAALSYLTDKNKKSMDRVLEAAEGLIRYFASLYGGGCSGDDLFQAGNVGLLKALRSFDPDRGVSFVTYSSHAIMGEIRHLVRKEASYYRPGCIVELQNKVDQVISEYTMENGIAPSAAYIADVLKIKEESVLEVMKAGFVSFEEIDFKKIHSTSYETFKLPIEDKLTLYQAIKKLSDMQQKIIQMLFFHDMTQQQAAETLGISQKQVSRLKEKSVQILREHMDEE